VPDEPAQPAFLDVPGDRLALGDDARLCQLAVLGILVADASETSVLEFLPILII
jgi:hypothetical protein